MSENDDDVKKMKQFLRVYSFPADPILQDLSDLRMYEATPNTINIVDKMRDILPKTEVEIDGKTVQLLLTDFAYTGDEQYELWFTSTGTRFGPSVQLSCILPEINHNSTVFEFLEALWHFVGSAEFKDIAQKGALYLPF